MPYRGVCSAGGTGWACRCFEQGLLWPAITGSMKVRSSSVSRSQGRALPSVLGTTLPCEEPETRNKGSSSHVAKAVCHGNIREPRVGPLPPLLCMPGPTGLLSYGFVEDTRLIPASTPPLTLFLLRVVASPVYCMDFTPPRRGLFSSVDPKSFLLLSFYHSLRFNYICFLFVCFLVLGLPDQKNESAKSMDNDYIRFLYHSILSREHRALYTLFLCPGLSFPDIYLACSLFL